MFSLMGFQRSPVNKFLQKNSWQQEQQLLLQGRREEGSKEWGAFLPDSTPHPHLWPKREEERIAAVVPGLPTAVENALLQELGMECGI